jgi:hypothetical protein
MSSTWQNSVFLLRFYISPFNHLYLCEYQNRTQTIYTRSERYRHSDVMPTKSLQNKVHSFYLSTSCSLSIKNILCTPNTNFFYFYLIVIELCQRSPTHTVFDMWSLSLQPPMIHGLPDTLRINPININPNLTTFSVDDPSDNVTCMINKTSPHTDMFILSLHGNGKWVMFSVMHVSYICIGTVTVIYVSCCLRRVNINRIRVITIVFIIVKKSLKLPMG